MMADFSKAMISTFERVKLFDRFSHRMRLLQSSRSELALAELCLPFPSVVRLLLVVIPHATTLFVFRSSCKLPLFPFIHRIISKYLVFFLLFHPIPYPSHKERRHVLLEVRNNMKDHLARLFACARIPIWYVLIFRLHLEAFKYFKKRISYHIILSAVSP